MRCARLVSAYNPKNLITTFLLEGILHKLNSFMTVFISGMFGRRVVFFFKFLVHFVLAQSAADLDCLLLKDISRQILQTVLK